MGFLKPKAPAPPEVPTAEPLVAQVTATEDVTDATKKKKDLLRTGKSSLTVQLKKDTAGLNIGNSPTTNNGLSVGGSNG